MGLSLVELLICYDAEGDARLEGKKSLSHTPVSTTGTRLRVVFEFPRDNIEAWPWKKDGNKIIS